MTTALDIINGAFANAGILAAETTLQSFEVQDGLTELNDMLASWDGTGLPLGAVPVGSVSDEVRLPRWAVQHVKMQLCVNLLSLYSKEMSAELALKVQRAEEIFMRNIGTIGEAAFPDTLPRGSGNSCNYDFIDSQFFPQNKKDNY